MPLSHTVAFVFATIRKMPRIFIDAERLRDLNSGLGQVCLNLGHELIRQCPDPQLYHLTFGVPKGLAGIFGEQVSYYERNWLDKVRPIGQYDVWHALHQGGYLPTLANPLKKGIDKSVLTIHDLNFLDRPDYSAAKKARKLAQLQQRIEKATVITAISEYTASVVRQHLKLRPDQPLKVIYNGLSKKEEAATTIDHSITQSLNHSLFFLFLGVIHPKKNAHVLLPLLQAFPDYKLVMAGDDSHGYAQHIRDQAQQIGVADQLVMAGAVDEATKWWLYEHCEAFLFPSLTEGFGLPVIEAMSVGKPVFLSNKTSLPEVGGLEAVYWENFEPDYMVETFWQGMIAYHDDPLKADRLRWRAGRFSWEKAANAYWEVYQALVP